MKKKNIKILVTLGPSSLNKDFLKFCKKEKVSLLRLNMSHIENSNLKRTIKFIKKFNSVTPICIDTEGAQIRTKITKKITLKRNNKFTISKEKGKILLYPSEVFEKLKKGDILLIGFDNLSAIVINKFPDKIIMKTLTSGALENNKGVHLKNRKIKLNFLTTKDQKAIDISKEEKIKNYALSFTNSHHDIIKFNKYINFENKIFKLETYNAIKNLHNIVVTGNTFLIDRGDLSKEISIEKIPKYQRKIISKIKKFKNKKVFVATNLLESMVKNIYPTRAEANDIFNCLESGVDGLVLAAETAIGDYPEESVLFLKKIILEYKKYK